MLMISASLLLRFGPDSFELWSRPPPAPLVTPRALVVIEVDPPKGSKVMVQAVVVGNAKPYLEIELVLPDGAMPPKENPQAFVTIVLPKNADGTMTTQAICNGFDSVNTYGSMSPSARTIFEMDAASDQPLAAWPWGKDASPAGTEVISLWPGILPLAKAQKPAQKFSTGALRCELPRESIVRSAGPYRQILTPVVHLTFSEEDAAMLEYQSAVWIGPGDFVEQARPVMEVSKSSQLWSFQNHTNSQTSNAEGGVNNEVYAGNTGSSDLSVG